MQKRLKHHKNNFACDKQKFKFKHNHNVFNCKTNILQKLLLFLKHKKTPSKNKTLAKSLNHLFIACMPTHTPSITGSPEKT